MAEDTTSGVFDDVQSGCFGALILLLVLVSLGVFGVVKLIT